MTSDPAAIAPRRALRAATFGATATALAAIAHGAGGGTVQPLAAAGALVAVTAAAYAAAGRERSPLGIGAAMVAVQLLLHLVLGFDQPSQAGALSCLGHTVAPAGQAWAMVALHLAAAAFLVLALARGEAALWAGWRRVRTLLARARPAGRRRAVSWALPAGRLALPAPRPLAVGLSRRGPPAGR